MRFFSGIQRCKILQLINWKTPCSSRNTNLHLALQQVLRPAKVQQAAGGMLLIKAEVNEVINLLEAIIGI